jgi:hypothetical protein
MQFLLPTICLIGGFFGLWQCWQGWRTGKMFAFDAGSAFVVSRSEGLPFVVGWWFTMTLSVVILALDFGVLFNK